MTDTERNIRIKSALINRALGVFIFLFGVIVIIAMAFAETFVQRMTDLVAGTIMIFIGGGMVWKARQTLKKHKSKESN